MPLIDRYLKPAPWQVLKESFSFSFVRLFLVWFAIAPTVYTVFDGLSGPIYFETAERTIQLNLSLPFHWHLLWVSSLSYFLGFAIYQLFCPSFIKKYSNYTDYKAAGHDKRWIVQEVRSVWNTVSKSSKVHHKKLFDRLYSNKKFLKRNNEAKEESWVLENCSCVLLEYEGENWELCSQEDETFEKGVFWEVQSVHSAQSKRLRSLVRILLDIALSIFSIVVLLYIYKGLIIVLSIWCG